MNDITTLKTGAVTATAQAILLQQDFLRLRRIAIGTVEWRGRMRQYIAGDLKLTDEDRKLARQFRDDLRRLCSVGDENQARQERYRVIAKMLLAKPTAKASELSGAALGEVYQEALDDVPVWAVAEYASLWHRGECGNDKQYTWAPGTDVWRKGALQLIEPYRRAAEHLEALLLAQSFDEVQAELIPKPTMAEIESKVEEKLSRDLGRELTLQEKQACKASLHQRLSR